MSVANILTSVFKSAPSLTRMFLDLSWLYVTLDWRVRKARRAFEDQLISSGMSKNDARRLSACYEEVKNSITAALKQGMIPRLDFGEKRSGPELPMRKRDLLGRSA